MSKKKLEKEYLRYYQEINDETKEEYSQFLFGREFSTLDETEKARLYHYQCDKKYPIWKYIYLYGNLTKYSVSNTGEVRNNENGMILKQKDQRGYKFINLTVRHTDGTMQRRTFSVHRLVAMAFIPNPENKPEVNHMNGNKKCNWLHNLEWATSKENIDHAIRTGLVNNVGVNNARNRFPESTIRKVCELLEQGKEATEISKLVDCEKYIINSIKQGVIWKHISKDYNIPKPVNKTRPEEWRNYMFELIMAGYSDYEVAEMMGLPMDDNIKSVAYVGLARRRYLRKHEE